MRIVLVNSPVEENKGKYKQLTLKYQSDGKEQERKLVSFNHKEVYNLLSKAGSGDAFDITLKKGEKYWEWVEAKAAGKGEVSNTMPSFNSGGRAGNWETAGERAARQIYIVRQSSIASAVALQHGLVDITPEQIIDIAKKFEAYVFGKEAVDLPDQLEPQEVD